MKRLRVALVHEWLEGYAGSERVLEQLLDMYPEADLCATVDFVPEGQRGFLRGKVPRTTFIQKLPFARKRFRAYIGLMPLAIEQHDLSSYDLVISVNHALSKGVLTGPDTLHVSYICSPIRYAWDLQHQYLRQAGLERGVRGAYARWQLSKLRQWDVRTANGVDLFVSLSAYISRRIRKCYRRDSVLVPPPVDVERFELREEKQDFYVLASRMVPYKRMDLVAAAFADMPERKLVIVGDGPERENVVRAARGAANISFVGAVATDRLVELMQQARAFIFAAEEDFGIMMVEAQACGTPVIAFGRGGALDIVGTNPPTGLFFEDQTSASVADAVRRFESMAVAPAACRENALRFSGEKFRARMGAVIAEALAGRDG